MILQKGNRSSVFLNVRLYTSIVIDPDLDLVGARREGNVKFRRNYLDLKG